MKIDLDHLSEAELTDLNHRIVARLRFLHQARAHMSMLAFKIGDRVAFDPDGRASVIGMLTKYNRKSVTVITDDGAHWTVAPGLLRKAGAGEKSAPGPREAEIVPMRKK